MALISNPSSSRLIAMLVQDSTTRWPRLNRQLVYRRMSRCKPVLLLLLLTRMAIRMRAVMRMKRWSKSKVQLLQTHDPDRNEITSGLTPTQPGIRYNFQADLIVSESPEGSNTGEGSNTWQSPTGRRLVYCAYLRFWLVEFLGRSLV